jgi:hypothetical protein
MEPHMETPTGPQPQELVIHPANQYGWPSARRPYLLPLTIPTTNTPKRPRRPRHLPNLPRRTYSLGVVPQRTSLLFWRHLPGAGTAHSGSWTLMRGGNAHSRFSGVGGGAFPVCFFENGWRGRRRRGNGMGGLWMAKMEWIV